MNDTQKVVPFNRELIDKMVEMSIKNHIDVNAIKESIKKELISESSVTVKIKPFNELNEFFMPRYATLGSSGMDICSCEDVSILGKGFVNSTKVVHTNISVEIPPGYEIQVRPRSGLAAKYGITILNTPGTIDSDYRGEIMVILHNTSTEAFPIKIGDRIAQMVLCKVERMELVNAEDLTETERSSGGLGSTGSSVAEYMDFTSMSYLTKVTDPSSDKN